MEEPTMYLTRVECFSACHRLHSPMLTDDENKATYGKCNNVNGHGHNYKVEVKVRGKVSEETGMVINLVDLKRHIQVAILDVLDHKNIDKDVPYFKDKVSTTENLCLFIWKSLSEQLSDGLLHSIKVYETDKNVVEFKGEF